MSKSWTCKLLVLLANAGVALAPSALYAANATWSLTPSSADWIPSASQTNWSTGMGLYPSGTDSATFTGSSSQTTININSTTLSIKNIGFVGTGASAPTAYTIGSTSGNALTLASGGAISIGSTVPVAAGSQTINAPLLLAGSFAFQNSAASSVSSPRILTIGGAVTNSTNSGIVLTLTGANSGSGSTVSTLSGVLGNGTLGGTLGVTKSSSGIWAITAANQYSGPTSITGGTLLANNAINGSDSATGASDVSISSGATLGGKGNVSGTVTVAGSIAPGATNNTVSYETLTTGGQNLVTGGSWQMEVLDATTHDRLNLGTIDSTQVTAGTKFTVNLLRSGTSLLAAGTDIILAHTTSVLTTAQVQALFNLTENDVTNTYQLIAQSDGGNGTFIEAESTTPEVGTVSFFTAACSLLILKRRRALGIAD